MFLVEKKMREGGGKEEATDLSFSCNDTGGNNRRFLVVMSGLSGG